MIFFVLDKVDLVLQDGVIQPAFEALSGFVATPLRMGMILLIAAHGFKLMKGNTQGLSTVDVGWLVLKMGLVTELLINWPLFNEWVYGVVWDTYTGLGNALAKTLDSHTASLFGVIDIKFPTKPMFTLNGSTLDAAFQVQLAGALAQALGVPEAVDVGMYPVPFPIPILGSVLEEVIKIPIRLPSLMSNIAGLIKFVMTIVLFASVFIVMLLSRLGLISCLAVAPIFIALALFEHTRSYTDAWFRGMLGFVLTPMLLMLVLMVGDASIAVLDAGPSGGWPGSTTGLNVIGPAIAYLLLYYALAKSVASVPQFASGMVGSLLANLGDGAGHQLVGRLHQGADAGVGAAKGAVKGFMAGGPAGAKAGALRGAVGAMR